MKNITFRANKKLIEKARSKALENKSTLNEEFQKWLAQYVASDSESMSLFSGVNGATDSEMEQDRSDN